MEKLKAIAAWVARSYCPVSRLTRPHFVSRQVRGHITALSLMLAVSLFSGAALGQNLQWAKRAGGTSADYGRAIAVDGSGNSYVTGGFGGTATFGLGEVNETTLTAVGPSDIFVAKFSGGKKAPADYDGDGKTDIAVYRNGLWIIQRSSGGTTATWFGGGTDVPLN